MTHRERLQHNPEQYLNAQEVFEKLFPNTKFEDLPLMEFPVIFGYFFYSQVANFSEQFKRMGNLVLDSNKPYREQLFRHITGKPDQLSIKLRFFEAFLPDMPYVSGFDPQKAANLLQPGETLGGQAFAQATESIVLHHLVSYGLNKALGGNDRMIADTFIIYQGVYDKHGNPTALIKTFCFKDGNRYVVKKVASATQKALAPQPV